jgi:hypothetical protein
MALHPVLHAGHEQAVRTLRVMLREEAYAALWAEGRTLSREEAVALALAQTDGVLPGS